MTPSAVYFITFILCTASIFSNAQLTQTVGWGSGGSHGKRGSTLIDNVNNEEMESCNGEALLVDDILLLVQVGIHRSGGMLVK